MSVAPAKKRIVIFSTAYLPLIGGAELAVKEITARLPEHEFVLITARLKPDLPAFERIGNVDVYRVGRGSVLDKYWLIWHGPRLASRLGHFDVVWAIMASYAGFAALQYKKQHPAVPYLLTLQEGDSRWDIYKHVWWCWPYFKQIFTRANRIQAISTYLAAWAKELGARVPIDVVPNGVVVEQFAVPVPDMRVLLGIPVDARVVVTSSRLVPKNGVGSLVLAMSFLPPDVHLVIVGSGKEKERIHTLVARQQFGQRVHMVGGVPYEQLPPYLRMANVFCRPSISEGLGIAFLDAMAAGLPIVGTAVGGIPDFLREGETGLFCRVNDPLDIAEKIQRILTDAALAERLRTNGLALVREKYQWDAIANDIKKIFETMI